MGCARCSFKAKAAKTGADWREWMYGELKEKRGMDPREHWAQRSNDGNQENGGGGRGVETPADPARRSGGPSKW
eukprot:SAG11_NODE_26995_length_338_cov_1.058577_1_plen_73_part_10